MKKLLFCVIVILVIVMLKYSNASGNSKREFTSEQQARVDEITKICIENWDKYGVLPSTCIAQAMIESTMGEHCSGYNYWGIKSGAESYSSTYEATIRYLNVINNGYYDGAPFEMDTKTQLRKILDGGYCVPEGDYYNNASWIIDNYQLKDYDKPIFDRIEKQKLKKARSQKFKIVYDKSVPKGTVYINPYIKKNANTITMYVNDYFYDYFDVKPRNIKKCIIKTSDKNIAKKKCTCIFSNARG